jgi:formylglycine-generating enzyme required for sulfatase activity
MDFNPSRRNLQRFPKDATMADTFYNPSDIPEDHRRCSASRADLPQAGDVWAAGARASEVTSTSKRLPSEMVHLNGGEFLMGTDDPIGSARR